MDRDFRSIRHPIALEPARGSLAEERDYAAHVEQLMRQVLLTNPGERVNRPDFGCGLRGMVFAPLDPTTMDLVRVTARSALERWRGSVLVVRQIDVTTEANRLELTVTYQLRARQATRVLSIEVSA